MLIDQLADVEENPRALASRIFEPRQAFARGGGFYPFAIYGKWGEISLRSVKPCMRSVKLCPRWERSETSRHAPLNVGFVGANTIGVLDFSPTYYQGIPP